MVILRNSGISPLSSRHIQFWYVSTWTDAATRNAPIEMADTSYGRFLATQKRDAERAYRHMDAEEREAFLRKLTEIDADDAEDGQSPPSNPTPV